MTPCPLHPETERPCATCGINRVRAAFNAAPRTHTPPDNTIHGRALTRARTERANTKEAQP